MNMRKDMEKKKCLIIYTGGTFGMTPDAEGVLHPTTGFLEKKIASMDEFKFGSMPQVVVLEWEDAIDSSDMNPEDWKRIGRQIEDNYWDYDGFLVLQGTDTMAYTASALSFMLQHLGKPVVVAGAMIPLHFPHSDARRNLIMSTLCAATLDIPEVCIYSNDKLLRGNRTTKTSNMTVDAFTSPNFPILASTGVETVLDQELIIPHPKRRFSLFSNLCTDVCVFHLVPGFNDACIQAYIQQQKSTTDNVASAVVFSLYGTGNAPTRKGAFIEIVQQLLNANIAVVVTSQCAYGRTKLNSYATGIKLLKMGVIATFDMTIEACVTKLAYLMGHEYTLSELKQHMETNLKGELTSTNDTTSTTLSNTRKSLRNMLE